MIGRADIEGSKSDVAMNAWPPQASSVIPTSIGRETFHLALQFSVPSPVAGSQSPVGVARTLSLLFRVLYLTDPYLSER